MRNQPHAPQAWQLLAIAALIPLAGGAFCSMLAQGPNYDTKVARVNRSPNPKVNMSHTVGTRPGNRTPKVAPGINNRLAIEEALDAGNKARDVNNYELAITSYRKVIDDPKSLDERAYYGLGNVYMDLYCHDSAVGAYLNALKRKNNYLEALVGLGYAYAGKERFDDAEAQFRAALNLKSDSSEANIGLGRIHLMKGKYQDAINQINLVINSPAVEIKDRASAYVVLGHVYWKQEKRKKAVAQFEEAIRLKPDFAWAYVELGNARSAVAYSKARYFSNPNEVSIQELEEMHAIAKQATATLEDARKYGYNHPQVHQYLALSLAYQTRYDDAIGKVNDYFAEIQKLEDRLSANASGCGPGFNRLRADGFLYLGYVSYLQGLVAKNPSRKNEFLNKAREHFTESIKLKEDHVSSNYLLGTIYTIQQKHEAAIEQYKKAIRFTTEESVKADLYGSIGVAYNSLGKSEEALQNAQEAIRRNPNKGDLYDWLAGIYQSMGKLEESLVQLEKADALRSPELTADGTNTYYSLGVAYGIGFLNKRNEQDFTDAVKALRKMVELRPKFAASFDTLGGLYLIKGDAAAALENYEKAINLDPDNPTYYMNVGRVYSELKNNDDAAIQSFKKAIEIKSDLPFAHHLLGNLYHRRKDDVAAIKHFQDAIKYNPKFLQSYLDVANIFRGQKNYDEAIKYLTAAIGVAPKKPEPYQQLGLVYFDRSNADEALKNFNRAVEYDPNNFVNYFYLATVYSKLKHEDEPASKQLLKAIELNAKDPDLYSALAEIHKRQRNYPEAVRVLMVAIKHAPKVPWIYKDMAKVYEAQKMNGEAVRYYEEALKRLDANDSSTRALYLGRKARLLGNYAEAIEYFRKVNYPEEPGQSPYEIGVVYVVSKNKKAALAQYEQLKKLKSSLAEDLLTRINELN